MTTMTETSARFREFKMPDVGEGLTEAEILKWFVQPGDTVTDGQVVCEVETAKAAVELPIPFDGVVHELRFPEGSTVDVGEVIIAVDVAPGSGDAPAVDTAAETVQQPVPEAEPEAEAPKGRQPVLVGYGVAESSTKRRARKGAEIPGPPPPRSRPRSTATARRPWRVVPSPSHRCASWRRTWASTSPRSPRPGRVA